ncbi:MAG TPA: ABC transporter permease subunit [Actinomycetota bacterium]|nr:ABC transporter permease subunit [Actinomycetota bacterium]
MRLFGAEVRRLGGRRMFRYLLLVGLAVLVVLGVVQAIQSSRDIAGAQARARREAAAAAARFAALPPGLVPQCKGGPDACAFHAPTADEIYQGIYQDPRYSFAEHAPNVVVGIVIAAGLVGFVIGASFIGAEWASGTMASLLTWEPRRLRVLVAKLGAGIVVLVVLGAVAIALGLAGSWLIAATRGTTAHTTGHVVALLISRGGRGLVLVALLTGAGTAISGFTRHTVAAVAATVGYLVIVEIILRHLRPGWVRWYLTTNAAAALAGKTRLFVPPPPGGFAPFTAPQVFVLHASRGFIYLTALLVALVAIWALTFTRRDIDEGGGR